MAALIRLHNEGRTLSGKLSSATTRDNGVLVKKPEVSTADYDVLTAARAELRRSIVVQERRVDAARKHLNEIIHSLSNQERKACSKKIATHAIEKHRESARLWAELQEVLTDRDQAYDGLGRPGHDWKKAIGALPNRFDGGVKDVKNIMDARVGAFDVVALSALASGESLPTQAERDAATQNRADQAATEIAQAVRRRR